MFRELRWRLVAVNVALLVLLVLAAGLFISRPGCVGSAVCIRQTLILVTAVFLALAVAASLLLAARVTEPIRELTAVVNRIAEGDVQARALTASRDEVGELVRSFDTMSDVVRGRIALLAEENDQFSTVLEKMADGVLIIDDASRVIFANPAALRLLTMAERDVLGRSFAGVVRHHQLIDLWQRCQHEGREQVAAVELGRDLFLQAYVTPFFEAGLRSYLIILQDLTQVRRLQTIRRDFVSNISHELRTPLASLRAVVETLQDGAVEEPELAHRFLERAEREIDTLTQMVEELLELSRIESGQVPLQLKPTAVADLILVPLERLLPQAERNDIHITLDIPAGLPLVVADEARMQQVVTNLLHNAIKFTPADGEIRIRAELQESQAEQAEVLIAVEDNGYGIPAADLPRIFERFYKSDRARTRGQGGTGLGLAIARHIVQAHHGRVWATSKEGKGSKFYFTVPVST